MSSVAEQKKKLEQKKARLQKQEITLKLKERRARTRQLIKLGGLVAKAGINGLEDNVLLGAFLSIKDSLEDEDKLINWKKAGADCFAKDNKDKSPVILKFNEKPDNDIRTIIRAQGLKWNALRKEWYGYVIDVTELELSLDGLDFKLEVMP
jgi:hypothetical protein